MIGPDMFLFELDPRTKLILTLLSAVLVILSTRWYGSAITLGLLGLIIVHIRAGHDYGRWLRLVFPMTAFWFALVWWSTDHMTAIMAGLRLLALASVFFVFFQTTAPEDLGNVLVKAGLPYACAFVVSAALQFVPVLSRKAQHIIDAQRARGIPLEPGFAALRYYPALLAPLLIQSFQLADDLAEAMEARGFGRAGRTFWRDYCLRRRDWLALALAGVICVGLVVFT